MYKLIQIVSNDEIRYSGNGCFPAPQKKDVGKKVVVIRRCSTWDGSLGYFDDDSKKVTHAFYDVELQGEKD